MTTSPDLVQNLLVVAATQCALGAVGVLTRRSLFHMALSVLIMLQGFCLGVATLSCTFKDASGTAWLFVIWGMSIAQAVIVATFFLVIARRRRSTDIAAWRILHESERDPFGDPAVQL